MSGYFSYEDLFVFGIGCDIAGATLLAKGLLLSSRQILNLASSYYDWSPPGIVSRVEDKVSTYIGVGALVLGFALQFLGYVFDLGLRSTFPASPVRALLAIAIAAFGIILVALVYRLLLPPWRKRLLLDIARYDKADKQPHPYGHYLVVLGTELGFPGRAEESQIDYAKRVWHVDNIIEGGPPEQG